MELGHFAVITFCFHDDIIRKRDLCFVSCWRIDTVDYVDGVEAEWSRLNVCRVSSLSYTERGIMKCWQRYMHSVSEFTDIPDIYGLLLILCYQNCVHDWCLCSWMEVQFTNNLLFAVLSGVYYLWCYYEYGAIYFSSHFLDMVSSAAVFKHDRVTGQSCCEFLV